MAPPARANLRSIPSWRAPITTRCEPCKKLWMRRLKAMRKQIKEIRGLHPDVVRKYRAALLERIHKAGLPISSDDERLTKEITFFADRADVSEGLTRVESHLAQFAHHLRRHEPVGRTLEFITLEIFREQIQNLE